MRLRIKELREESGMTQQQLAERLDNAQRNVSNWENGAAEPDCDTILRLAEVFGVPIDELFGRDTRAETERRAEDLNARLAEATNSLSDDQKAALILLIRRLAR